MFTAAAKQARVRNQRVCEKDRQGKREGKQESERQSKHSDDNNKN